MSESLDIGSKSNNFRFYFRLAFPDQSNPYFLDYITAIGRFSHRERNPEMTEKFHIIPKVFFKTRKLKTYSDSENVIMVTPREYIGLYQMLSCYCSGTEQIDVYLGIIRHLKKLTGRSVLEMKRNGTYLSEDDIARFENGCKTREVMRRSGRGIS